MTTYPTRNSMANTVRGALGWLVFWTVLSGSTALLTWHGHRLWPIVFAVLLTPLVSGRILFYLHQREQAGHLPSDSDGFLLDQAMAIPMVWSAAVMSLSSATWF